LYINRDVQNVSVVLKKENRKRLKDRLTVENVEITMEGDSAAPVRQSDRTSKDDPDEMELRPATCVTNEGHDENQQQSTSHVTPTCLEDAPEASSVHSGDDIISPSPSTYSNIHEPIPLPVGASCDPPTDSPPASLSRKGRNYDIDYGRPGEMKMSRSMARVDDEYEPSRLGHSALKIQPGVEPFLFAPRSRQKADDRVPVASQPTDEDGQISGAPRC